jgi:hypothetical protein
MKQKKIAYQYTEWSKRKLPVSVQNGAKENCLSMYRMEKIKIAYQHTEWSKIKIAYQHTEWSKRKLTLDV